MNGTELCSFTASLNGQIGKARLTTEGVVFVAAGGVHTAVELRCSDMIKFKVTPEKNPKAILRFELAPPEKPFMLQVATREIIAYGRSLKEGWASAMPDNLSLLGVPDGGPAVRHERGRGPGTRARRSRRSARARDQPEALGMQRRPRSCCVVVVLVVVQGWPSRTGGWVGALPCRDGSARPEQR
jgi:hypothetical protein